MSDNQPSNWKRTTVQEVIIRSFSGHSPTCEERPIVKREEWGFLKTTAITWDGWNEDAHKVAPQKYWGKRSLEIKAGDVLITKAGPRHRVGVVVHVPSIRPHLMVSGKIIGIRPNCEKVLPGILAVALSMREPQVFLDHRTTGMAESQVNFNNDTLLSTPILLPPMPEQQAIAIRLDIVDEAIQLTEALIQKVRCVKSGMLYDLLTRGLDENGELRDPTRHPEQFKDSPPLGRIPKQWMEQNLGEALMDGPRNGFSPKEAARFTGTFVLGLSCLTVDGFEPIQLKPIELNPIHSKYILQEGDLLISRSNTPDRVALPGIFRDVRYKCIYPDLMMRIQPKPFLLPRFMELLLRYSRLRQFLVRNANGTSSSMVKINSGTVCKSRIAYPEVPEQQRILDTIIPYDHELSLLRHQNRKLKSLKQALMQDLLTGRVRVANLQEMGA